MREARELLDRMRALRAAGAPAAVVTIVAVDGSAYRREGARMIVEPDGALTGVLSGGCVERELLAPARAVLADGRARTLRFDLSADEEAIWGFGLGCSGVVTVLLEPLAGCGETLERAYAAALEARREARLVTQVRPSADGATATVHRELRLDVDDVTPPEPAAGEIVLVERLPPPVQLVVLGAERDVVPLLRLAGELGWPAVCVDPRPTAAAEARVAPLARYAGAPPRRLGDQVPLDARSAVLVATHRYLDDLAYLGELASAPVGYLGVLGPRRRRERLLADLGRQDAAAARRCAPALRGPAGLDLGGRTPHEIALAVAAEIQAALCGGSGAPLAAKSVRAAGEPALPPR
jgi:xanthine/CO dehydrogenase XdhC/CoxF family maturation factor